MSARERRGVKPLLFCRRPAVLPATRQVSSPVSMLVDSGGGGGPVVGCPRRGPLLGRPGATRTSAHARVVRENGANGESRRTDEAARVAPMPISMIRRPAECVKREMRRGASGASLRRSHSMKTGPPHFASHKSLVALSKLRLALYTIRVT